MVRHSSKVPLMLIVLSCHQYQINLKKKSNFFDNWIRGTSWRGLVRFPLKCSIFFIYGPASQFCLLVFFRDSIIRSASLSNELFTLLLDILQMASRIIHKLRTVSFQCNCLQTLLMMEKLNVNVSCLKKICGLKP